MRTAFLLISGSSGCLLVDALQRETVELLVGSFLLIEVLLQNSGAVFAAELFGPWNTFRSSY